MPRCALLEAPQNVLSGWFWEFPTMSGDSSLAAVLQITFTSFLVTSCPSLSPNLTFSLTSAIERCVSPGLSSPVGTRVWRVGRKAGMQGGLERRLGPTQPPLTSVTAESVLWIG